MSSSGITKASVVIKDSSTLGISLPNYLPAPELITPENNRSLSNRPRVQFAWSAVTGADNYEFQLSESSNFYQWESLISRTVATGLEIGYAAEVEYPLKWEETHYWRVRALKGIQSSVWSEVYSFRIRPLDLLDRPFPPYVRELKTDHDELKPVSGTATAKNTAHIAVEMSEKAGDVDVFSWRTSGNLGTLESLTATSATFIAPTFAEIASAEGMSDVQTANLLCNVGTGRTVTVNFHARNQGGTSSGKCDINIRYQAGDEMTVEPTEDGADWSEAE